MRLVPAQVAPEAEFRLRAVISQEKVWGRIAAVGPLSGGELVAFDGGEFGGGGYFIPHEGEPSSLLPEPVVAVWQMGGLIYVIAGLSHLLTDTGNLYVIDPRGPRVERKIKLPASMSQILALSDRTLIVRTRHGDLALLEDGTLADAARASNCREHL